MSKEDHRGRMTRRNAVKLVVFACISLALVALSRHPWFQANVRFENLGTLVDQAARFADHPFAPLLFVAAFAALMTLYVPAAVMVVLGGLVFGFWEAVVLCWIGAMIGATGTFLIARYLLEDYFKPRLEQSVFEGLLSRLESDGTFTVLFLRLLFFLVPPFNWAIGATGVRFKDYVAGTAVGMLPWLLAILIAVNKLKTIRSARDLLQWESLAVGAGFALLLVFIGLGRRRFEQSRRK